MSLVIDDAHIENMKSFIITQCETIDSITSEYLQTMEKVLETGIMEGATAKALNEFLSAVKTDLGDEATNPDSLSSIVERYCINFIKQVDKADKDFY